MVSLSLLNLDQYLYLTVYLGYRGCLDVIPERVELPPNVNVAKNLEDEPEHKPEPKAQEPKNKSAGRKDHPGEAAKREENKGQADNFWTRLWGKKV